MLDIALAESEASVMKERVALITGITGPDGAYFAEFLLGKGSGACARDGRRGPKDSRQRTSRARRPCWTELAPAWAMV